MALLVAGLNASPAIAQDAAAAPGDAGKPVAKADPWGPLISQAVICPPVPDPRPSAAELQAQAHWRAETGTTCWWTGQCLLPNSYQYDALIFDALKRALQFRRAELRGATVWALVQRRTVTLQGCVQSAAQAAQIEALALRVESVEAVINQLQIGPMPPLQKHPASRTVEEKK
ncbi:hypothetical protein IP84_10575 [beta proteobacterium AAP99]|nr:hypothetical protein IP84_10575 [beta proteobacterium AAP99]